MISEQHANEIDPFPEHFWSGLPGSTIRASAEPCLESRSSVLLKSLGDIRAPAVPAVEFRQRMIATNTPASTTTPAKTMRSIRFETLGSTGAL